MITANEALHGSTSYPLKKTVDEALKRDCTNVRLVLVTYRTETQVPLTPGRDFSLDDVSDSAIMRTV